MRGQACLDDATIPSETRQSARTAGIRDLKYPDQIVTAAEVHPTNNPGMATRGDSISTAELPRGTGFVDEQGFVHLCTTETGS